MNNTLLGRDSVLERRIDNLLGLFDEVAPKVVDLLELFSFMRNFNTDLIIEMCYSWGSTFGREKVEKMLADPSTNFSSLVTLCKNLGLDYTLEKCRKVQEFHDRLMEQNEGRNLPTPTEKADMRELVDKLQDSLKWELSARVVLVVEKIDHDLYKHPTTGWAQVIKAWPDSKADIRAASRTLALNQPTACIYHLSRIAERGLRDACAKYIPATSLPQPPFQMMGRYLQCIETFAAQRPERNGASELTEAATYFRPIKTVWRDDISHVGSRYTKIKARRCYVALRDMLIACAKLV